MIGAITREAGYGRTRIVLIPCADYASCKGFRKPGGHVLLSVRSEGSVLDLGRITTQLGTTLLRQRDYEDKWFESAEDCAAWCERLLSRVGKTRLQEQTVNVYAGGM